MKQNYVTGGAIGEIKRLDKNIATGLHYPLPLHLQKAYDHLGYKEGDFPIAEQVSERIFALPMHPYLSEADLTGANLENAVGLP